MNIFNKALSQDQFHKERLQALLTIIPKPDKDSSLPGNYRPISLLNSDLKIYAKTLALRLLDLLPSLIHPDQVGFVKGLQVPDATRCMIHILKNIELHKTPALYLVLDAEKAFNQVHWGYLRVFLLKLSYTVLYCPWSYTLSYHGALHAPLGQSLFIWSIIIGI